MKYRRYLRKVHFRPCPRYCFILRNEAQLSKKYQRRRPGWCICPLPGRKVLYQVTEVQKSNREKYGRQRPGWCMSLLPGKEKYYVKTQKYRKVPLTVSWLVHMSSAKRGSCATNPPLLLQPAFLESLRPSSTFVSKYVHSLNI